MVSRLHGLLLATLVGAGGCAQRVESAPAAAQTPITPVAAGDGAAAPVVRAERVRETMQGMAESVRLLASLLDDADQRGQQPDAGVVRGLLKEVAQQMGSLRDLPPAASALSWNDDLRGFLGEVAFAHRKAAAQPPDFSPAKAVVGACVYCHDLRPCRGRPGNCPDVPGL